MPSWYTPDLNYNSPQVDFSGLARLPEAWRQAHAYRQQQDLRKALSSIQPGDVPGMVRAIQMFGNPDQQVSAMGSLQPKLEETGVDFYGNPIKSWVGSGPLPEVRSLNGASSNPAGTGPAPSANNPSSPTQKLPPELQPTVNAMVAGRVPPPTPYMMARKPQLYNALIFGAQEIDPNFDFTSWGARYKARTGFAPGGAGFKDRQAAEQLLNHLMELRKAGIALDNWHSGSWGPLTSLANAARVGYLGQEQDPRIGPFEQSKNAVIDELSKNWKGTGGTSEADIERWSGQIRAAQSPEELNAVIHQIGSLIEGRLRPYQEQIQGIPGMEDIRMLSPQSQTTFDTLMKETASKDVPWNDPFTENSPSLSQGNGATATNPANGHKIIVRNGKWVDAQTGQPVQ